MFTSKKKWKLPATYYQAGSIAEYILKQRGYQKPIEDFIKIAEEQLYSPFLMKGMKKAVSRIQIAIEKKEKIMIYGDYDADGITGTSLLYLSLKDMGANVRYYIPNRFSEGYGLHKEAIQLAKDTSITLVITVDTGISAVEEVEFAKQLEMDVIITDHHEPPTQAPDAYCILNPKYKPCEYPEDSLAGVGVVCKLVSAIMGHLPYDYMDLVALGTVADLVPLVGENRILVALGLKKINDQPSNGIEALLQVTGLKEKAITAGHIGFQLAPRINASGRIDAATISVELLLSKDMKNAILLAEKLQTINEKRQDLVEYTYKAAEERLVADSQYLEKNKVIILADEAWNHGVIGIVASRILEKHYRPVILIALDGDVGKGSARSIRGYHMFHALQQCEHLFEKYGGHAMAAGLSIKAEHLPALQVALNNIADMQLSAEDYIPSVSVDIILTVPEIIIQQQQISTIELLAPYGMGHAQPKVLVTGAKYNSSRVIGKDKTHVKFSFSTGNYHLDVIGFQWAERLGDLTSERIVEDLRFELVGELSLNSWNDKVNPQLVLHDCAISPLQFVSSSDKSYRISTFLIKHGFDVECIQQNAITKEKLAVLIENIYRDQSYGNPNQHKKVYLVSTDTDSNVASDGDGFLSQVCFRPKRDDFTKAYKLLVSRMSMEKKEWVEACTQSGLDREYCLTMLGIFKELGFAIIDAETIKATLDPKKKNLEDSEIYARLEQRAILLNKHCCL